MRTRMRRLWMMSGASLSCLTGKGLSESRMIARYRQARVGRSTRPGDCQDRVKVRVQGHHDGALSQRPREDLIIGGLTHPDFPDMNTFIAEAAQASRGVSRNSLVQDQAHGRAASQAALLSAALSSRLAAANASAC